jgi:hypothetical protein
MKDLHNQIEVRRAISPVNETGTTALVSQIIDRQGFESLEFAIAIGSLADSNATFAVLVEDGDDSGLSDNGAVDDTELLGTEALAGFQFDDDNEVRKIGYRGHKRYVRLTLTPAGNSDDAYISAVALLGHPSQAPTA